MSKVIRASVLGCCMGVRRAIKAAENALTDYADCEVYSLGPLIHNKTALEPLYERGLSLLDPASLKTICGEPPDAENQHNSEQKKRVAIIRAHGVSPDVRKKLQNAGIRIEDATCPRVLVNQKRVSDYAAQKYTIIIAGDKSHGEVAALVGEAVQEDAEYVIVQNEADAKLLAQSEGFADCKAILISQTTAGLEEYEAIRRIVCAANPSIKVFDTICPATKERQDALKELCDKVDGVIVVGGKNSANTKRLFQTAKELCPHAAHIETPDEIPEEFFRLEVVGITAGASTPDDVIRGVENRLLKNGLTKKDGE